MATHTDPITLNACEDWPSDTPFPFADFDARKERRFEIETVGAWRVVKSVRAWACTFERAADGKVRNIRLWGDRTLTRVRESGYQLEGRVKLNGKDRRAFTSSILIKHNGKLYQAAILYVCL